jgi:hypothetical protein
VFFEAFIVEEVDGVGDKGSGDAIPLAQILLEDLFERVSEICLCY